MNEPKVMRGAIEIYINGKRLPDAEINQNGQYVISMPVPKNEKCIPIYTTKASRMIAKWVKGSNEFERKRSKFIDKHKLPGKSIKAA